jgi:hypothetical protein
MEKSPNWPCSLGVMPWDEDQSGDPGATLRNWQLDTTGYRINPEARAKLLEQLELQAPLARASYIWNPNG